MGVKRCFILMVIGLVALGTGKNAEVRADRPSLWLNADELARLSKEIKTVPWKRALYEAAERDKTFMGGGGYKPNAERWLKREIEIPARSGHYHNFFCDDGNELTCPQDLKPHPEGYSCPVCGRVYKGEKYDACVRWKLHNQLAVAAFDMAFVYAIEGDERYAAKAAEILLKYADAYPGPHTSHTDGGIMYQSLCEAVWVIPLACAYDFIFDSEALSPGDKVRVEGKLFKPVAQGLVKVGTHGNWGSWHLSAVGVIGYAIRDQALIDYAVENFKLQIANQLGDDGLWPESVHTYHFYPLGAFLYLAEAALHNGTDLYNWEAKPGKSLKSMFIVPLSYMYPDFRLPAINDGWFKSYLPLHQYELAHARYIDPVLGWALEEGYRQRKASRAGLWALLHGRPLDHEFKAPDRHSVNFPVLGIAVLRSPGENVMTFDYGPHLGHGQADKMGVTLFANGKLLAADYGTPGYGSRVVGYYRSTPGHNTVVVDGKSQQYTSERRLTEFGGGETFEVAEAETEQAYPGVLHKRAVIRIGENFIISDHLTSKSEHTYDWFLRCEGDLDIGLKALSELALLNYEYVQEKAQYRTDGDWDARWNLGEQGLALFMLGEGSSLVTAARCPAETAARTVPLVIARRTGKSVEFLAALVPCKGESDVKCSLADGLVKVEHDGLVDWVYVGKKSPGSPLQTDGKYAFVRIGDGEPVLGAVIGGETVSWRGRVVQITPKD